MRSDPIVVTQHATMQLYEVDGIFDIIVTRQRIDGGAVPRRWEHRNVTLSSVCRFFELSGGYRTAYSEKPPRREHELPY